MAVPQFRKMQKAEPRETRALIFDGFFSVVYKDRCYSWHLAGYATRGRLTGKEIHVP